MKLLDSVALRRAFPQHGLLEGRQGAIVEVFEGGHFEVEFVNPDGTTAHLGSFAGEDLRLTHEHPAG